MQVTLLIGTSDLIEDTNYLRLGNEMRRRGIAVACCVTDTLEMHASGIVAQGFYLEQPIKADQPFPPCHTIDLIQSDVVWTLNLGMRHSFLDKMQLLKCLESQCRLINSLDALMHFKSKYFLASHSEVFRYPPTYSSCNPNHLAQIIQEQGGKWIVKPPAGSLGRDIFLIDSDDPNRRVILETMTGPEADQYCLMQPFVEEIQQGEKRVLIAGGKPVGQYLRSANGDHRTNVTAGADIELCHLTPEEQLYCEEIGQFLVSQGAQYVGLDLAYPWVIEFNVVNPGGIQTLMSLGAEDLSPKIIDQILPD